MHRYTARTGSLLAVLALCVLCIAPARTLAQPTTYVFSGYSVGFTHLDQRYGVSAIAIDDAGLAALLYRIHASLTWKPGARSALITTSQPSVVSFTAGDVTYNAGNVVATSTVAPYLVGKTLFVPLAALLNALYLKPVVSGAMTYLQPQIGSLDVQSKGTITRVTAFSSIALHPHLLERLPTAMAYAFEGVGTALVGTRTSHLPGLRQMTVVQRGTITNPVTIVRLELAPGASVTMPGSDDGRDAVLSIAVAGTSVSAGVVAPALTTSSPAPAASLLTVAVTAVNAVNEPAGYAMMIHVTGNTSYEWHRLRAPDNRFWVDIHNAQLQMPAADYSGGGDVSTVRVRQIDAQTVRVALSLDAQKQVTVTPTVGGLNIIVSPQDALADDPHSGVGPIGNPTSIIAATPVQNVAQTPWKFGYLPTNPRLIVIDPGHGGSDPGSQRHGVTEASLTLDMAHRLRDVLIARGWQVILTHDTNVDVYGPNASAHDELQARDDIANKAGARILISIHVNAFINDGPSGTTTYYAKVADLTLARAVQAELASRLGTKNDGVIKSHFYVPLHANMPSILIETAFLSNPSDFSRLTDPQWRELVAEAMADGIADYAGPPPKATPAQQGDAP